MANGLFHVADRIYQVRGFDISNMTLIEGDRGVIVIDPLISTEVARAGLDLYRQHRDPRPVTAVIYTHSHVDHYGGVSGVVDGRAVEAGDIEVIAPDRFMEEIVSETVGGPAMIRRAQFQFGATLPKGPRGQVDAGLGKVTSAARYAHPAPRAPSGRRSRSITSMASRSCSGHAGDGGAGRDAHVLSGAPPPTSRRTRHTTYCITRSAARARDANAWAGI
jgi:alkyl sulfatase BDS1-like metallo-beta-lactamase superfamily hydrolase